MDQTTLMLALTCHGDEHQPALVMLHGFLGSASDWHRLIPMLSRHFYCVCIDLPGHGDSPILALNTPGFKQVCQAILAALDRLNIEYYHLLGYSLGGRIALHLAALDLASSAPSRLLSLNLESVHPGLTSAQDKQLRRASDTAWQQKLSSLTIEAFLALWYRQGVFNELADDTRQALVQHRSHNSPQALQSIYLATSLAEQADMSSLPTQLRVPCHYYVGSQDNKFLALAKHWQTLAPISVHRLQGAGHNVHLAAPDAFCRQLIHQLIGNPA